MDVRLAFVRRRNFRHTVRFSALDSVAFSVERIGETLHKSPACNSRLQNYYLFVPPRVGHTVLDRTNYILHCTSKSRNSSVHRSKCCDSTQSRHSWRRAAGGSLPPPLSICSQWACKVVLEDNIAAVTDSTSR